MTIAQCSPDNVLAELAHLKDRRGDEFDVSGVVDTLDDPGQALWHNLKAGYQSEMVKDTLAAKAVNKVVSSFADTQKNIKSIFSETLTPSEILGEDVVKPVLDYIQDHIKEFDYKTPEGRDQWYRDVIDINDGLLERASKNLSVEKYEYLRKYMKHLKEGGPLYKTDSPFGIWKMAINMSQNATKNIIALSNNVFTGNIVETLVKVPSEAGIENFGPAIGDVMKQGGKMGFWKRIPDVEKEGFYGLAREHGENELSRLSQLGRIQEKAIEKFQGLTDVPFKNIAYYAGERAYGKGGGLKMVEKLSNVQRLGNEPMMKWGETNSALSRFSHYTLGMYKMYGGWWKDAVGGNKDAWRKLVTYHGLVTLLGGPGANIPAPIADGLMALNPDWEEDKPWLMQTWGAGRLIQLQSVPIYVPVSIAINQSDKIKREWNKAGKYASEGDYGNAMTQMFQAGFSVLPFSNVPVFGLKPVQSVMKHSIDLAQQEIDWNEFYQKSVRDLQFEGFLGESGKE